MAREELWQALRDSELKSERAAHADEPHAAPIALAKMTILTLKAKHDHLQKVASMRDPAKALAEFGNALDADSTEVSVEFLRNGLGGMEGILIRDNGTGITRERAEHDFESLVNRGNCRPG